jgi:hypothetical protein
MKLKNAVTSTVLWIQIITTHQPQVYHFNNFHKLCLLFLPVTEVSPATITAPVLGAVGGTPGMIRAAASAGFEAACSLRRT